MIAKIATTLAMTWVVIHFCLHHYFRLLGIIAELLEKTERLQALIAEMEMQRGEP